MIFIQLSTTFFNSEDPGMKELFNFITYLLRRYRISDELKNIIKHLAKGLFSKLEIAELPVLSFSQFKIVYDRIQLQCSLPAIFPDKLKLLYDMFYKDPEPIILKHYKSSHGKFFVPLKFSERIFHIADTISKNSLDYYNYLPDDYYNEFKSYFQPSPFNSVVYRYIKIQPTERICAKGYTSTSLLPLDAFKSSYLMIIHIKIGDMILFLPSVELEIVLPECCLIQVGTPHKAEFFNAPTTIYTYEITPYQKDKMFDWFLTKQLLKRDVRKSITYTVNPYDNVNKFKKFIHYFNDDVTEFISGAIFKFDLELFKYLLQFPHNDELLRSGYYLDFILSSKGYNARSKQFIPILLSLQENLHSTKYLLLAFRTKDIEIPKLFYPHSNMSKALKLLNSLQTSSYKISENEYGILVDEIVDYQTKNEILPEK